MKKTLIALALIAAGSAQAATISFSDSHGLATTNSYHSTQFITHASSAYAQPL